MLVSSYLDNLGSPAVVTDNSGNVQKQYRYYAFGNLRAQSGSFNTDYSFTGYLKEETGNHYAKMRYYEGGIGKFMRVDPLGALNPYVYCGNDPLNFVDPEGTNQKRMEELEERQREGFNWLEYQDACYDYLDAGGTPYVWNKSPEETYREMTREWIEWNQFSGTDLAAILGYLWSSPNTALGLALGLLSLDLPELRGAEFYFNSKGGIMGLLQNLGWASAFALGHTIVSYDRISSNSWLYRHEMGHVRQYNILGPTFLPIYFGVDAPIHGFRHDDMWLERNADRYANAHTN